MYGTSDPRRNCTIQKSSTQNQLPGSGIVNKGLYEAAEDKLRTTKGFNLLGFVKAVALGGVMEGLGSAAFYGAGKGLESLWRSVKGNQRGTGVRYKLGKPVPVTEKTLDMALNPEMYANKIAEKYGINLRGSGQDIRIVYNSDLRPGIYGKTTAVTPPQKKVIEIDPDALMSEIELANTITHELNHAHDFIRGGDAMEPPAYSAGNALSDYINGGR